jgi:hypothetical protein
LVLDPGAHAPAGKGTIQVHNRQAKPLGLRGNAGFFQKDKRTDNPKLSSVLPGQRRKRRKTAGKDQVHQGGFDNVV